MPNVQQVFNEECHRISKKEVKAGVMPLAKTVSSLRREVIELRKQLKEALKRLDKVCPAEKVSEKTADSADAGKKFRLTPARIQKVREKTGLTKPQFAKLLGVNYISLINWESGKTKPRMEQLQKIAEVRGYGKRELKAAMDGKGIVVKSVKAEKAAKTGKKAVPQAKPAEEKVQEKPEK